MTRPSLTTYRFTAVLGDPDDPSSIVEHSVVAFGRDIQKVEALFAERKWGTTQDRPMTAAVAACYYALQRAGKYPGTFDDFESQYLEVSAGDPEKVFPTERAPSPASP